MMLPKSLFAVNDALISNECFPIYVDRNNPFYITTKSWK